VTRLRVARIAGHLYNALVEAVALTPPSIRTHLVIPLLSVGARIDNELAAAARDAANERAMRQHAESEDPSLYN
jgi:hypothetical protein